MIRLSVLDQSPVRAGATPADAVAETLALAQACDRLGYHRYWVAEHHSTPGLAGSAPEILIARLASLTGRIRVGAGGIMLTHYSPLKVAEWFRMLETLFPGRIDLGTGRAPGADRRTSMALAYGTGGISPDLYPRQMADLMGFMGATPPPDASFPGVVAMPTGAGMPEIWVLGSSDQSAMVAAWFGLPYSFAHFITDEGGLAAAASYREKFRPAPGRETPQVSIGVFVLCADTQEEARRLAASRDLWRLRLDRGEAGAFPTPEEAAAYPYTAEELARVAYHRRRNVIGTPGQVRERLESLAADYGAGEVVAVTITHDPAARLRSYELLAAAFGLSA